MKIKNAISLLILGTSIMTLYGCNNKNDGRVTIKIGFWPQNTDRKDVAMYEKWKDAFEEKYPQYRLEADPYTYSPDTVQSKAKAKTLPTIFQAWFTEPPTLYEKNYIRDCDAQLRELNYLDHMDSEMRQTLTFDNKVYGVPRDGYGLGLLLNKKILGECGLLPEIDGKYSIFNEDGSPAYPTTFDQIHDWSETIVELTETKGCLILTANKNGGWQFTNFAWNYGATLQQQDKDGKWYCDLTSDACVNALTWIKDMKADGLLLDNNTVYYDDWYSKIDSQVAMAFVGNDVLQLAKTKGDVNMDDLAFVPMPTGDGVHHYSLYGGTPFVFPSYASDEQVMGALRFLEFCGRSPIASEISKKAMIDGNEVAKEKSQPILPSIRPWTNKDYTDMADKVEKEYVNVNLEDYNEFYNNISANKHSEEPYYAQKLYEELDTCIQKVMLNPEVVDIKNILTTAEASFNNNYMSKVQ